MQVTILGKRWGFRFTRLPKGIDGECDDPSAPGKEIRIHKGLGEEDRLETIIHEAIHAANWHGSEEWVEQASRDIKRLLWRCGYRRQQELDESSFK